MIRNRGDKSQPAQIVSYPSYGFQTKSEDWSIYLAGIIFRTPPFNLRQRMLVRMLANLMHAQDQDLKCESFQQRIWPFFVEADRGQVISVMIDGKTFRLKKRTRRNGRFNGRLPLDDAFVRRVAIEESPGRWWLSFRLSTDCGKASAIDCSVPLLKPTGISVISDIDDTIKESSVGNRRELLWNTFVRDFRSVDGMAKVYQNWQDAGADFHYVSSSPWQLIGPLQQMQTDFGFPVGTMHLRNFRLRDQFLRKVLLRRKGKGAEIKRLVKDLPGRKFLLVGDSGEKDPEIYQKIGRQFRDQIAGIFIRQLPERPLNAERMEKLRRSSLGQLCEVFSSAADLQHQADAFFQRHGIQSLLS